MRIHQLKIIYLVYQVHIADGIQFIKKVANFGSADEVSFVKGNEDEASSSDKSCVSSLHGEERVTSKVDIVIIDVDSEDSR